MEKELNQSASFYHVIQKHHKYGTKKSSFSVIENLLNFTTIIPNSKLINVTIENLNSKTDVESIPPSKKVKDSGEIKYPVISTFEISTENLIDLNVETESSLGKQESFKTFVTNTMPEDSNFIDNSDESHEIPMLPAVNPSKHTKEFEAAISFKANMPYTAKTSDVLLQLSAGESDVIVTTTTRGMEVDFSDILNPKHISKATNYSTNYHLSTVTRSATVLADIVRPHIDHSERVDNTSLTVFNTTTHKSLNVGQVNSTNTKSKFLSMTDVVHSKEPRVVESIEYLPTLSPHSGKTAVTIQPKNSPSNIQIFPPRISDYAVKTHNTVSHIGDQNSHTETKSPILIEDASGSTKYDFSSSIVLSVGISCAFALLLFVILSLWLLRRNKYHSKVYLNYELAKPRTHIMKPMRPSVLPGETMIDNTIVDETESPREPIYLDQEMNTSTTLLHSKYSISMESCDSGIDNLAFNDVSSSEGQRALKNHTLSRKKENSKARRPTPKYMARKKKLLVDSSLKVCSSDGSIFPASPSLTKCLIPPPPYSPSIKNDSKLSLSLSQPIDDSVTKNPISSISEGCDHLPSQSSTVK